MPIILQSALVSNVFFHFLATLQKLLKEHLHTNAWKMAGKEACLLD